MFLLSTIINILQDDIVVVHIADGSHKNGGWADCWLILTLKPNFCSQDLFVFFFSFRKSWARSLFLLYNSGKPFKNRIFQNSDINSLCFCSFSFHTSLLWYSLTGLFAQWNTHAQSQHHLPVWPKVHLPVLPLWGKQSSQEAPTRPHW